MAGPQSSTSGDLRARRSRRGAFILFLAGLASGFAASGCQVEMPGGGRRQSQLALSPEQELQVGRQAYREILGKYRDQIVPADRPEVQRVRQIMARIVRAAGIEPLQREIAANVPNFRIEGYHFEWEVNVIKDRQINAFCLPGGKMAVFTGIFPVAEDDDQLATVMSHEISHALAHHASERLARDGSGLNWLLNKKHDRDQESQADKIGVFLMAFAGYDPRESVVFWDRMRRAHPGGSGVPKILSDHPTDEERIVAMKDNVKRAMAAKTAFDQGRIAPPRRR